MQQTNRAYKENGETVANLGHFFNEFLVFQLRWKQNERDENIDPLKCQRKHVVDHSF